MTVCQMMTGSGGWPLTIIMSPDKKKHYSPAHIFQSSHDLGLMELLSRVSNLWKTDNERLLLSEDKIVIVGDKDAGDTRSMLRALNDRYLPYSVVVFRDIRNSQKIDDLSSFVSGYETINGEATAYVCREFYCQLPTTLVAKMLEVLPVISPPMSAQIPR